MTSSSHTKMLALTASLLALIIQELAPEPANETPAPSPKPTGAKPSKPAPKPVQPVEAEENDPLSEGASDGAEGQAADSDAGNEEETSEAEEVTAATVREVLGAALNANKKDKAMAILAKYKAKNVTQLSPDNYAAVHAALSKLVG